MSQELQPRPPDKRKRRRRSSEDWSKLGAKAGQDFKAYIDELVSQRVAEQIEAERRKAIQAPSDSSSGKPPHWRSRFGSDY